MATGALGKPYTDGEFIVRQGGQVEAMYVIQEGQVEVLRETDGKHVHLTNLNEGDFFGEVPLFERRGHTGVARATVKAIGDVRALTVDKKTFIRRIHEDPSLAYRILQVMSRRIQQMEEEVTRLVVGQ